MGRDLGLNSGCAFTAPHQNKCDSCGSGLAREGGRSVDIDAECAGLFVSKPAPTLDRGQPRNLHSATIPSGSELAREGVRSVDIDIECAGPFVSKPTPTLFLVHRHILPTNMFGAL